MTEVTGNLTEAVLVDGQQRTDFVVRCPTMQDSVNAARIAVEIGDDASEAIAKLSIVTTIGGQPVTYSTIANMVDTDGERLYMAMEAARKKRNEAQNANADTTPTA